MMFSALLKFAVLAVSVSALPTSEPVLGRRAATQLTQSQLDSLRPFTEFARAAYCQSSVITDWSCGDACEAVSDFKPTLAGGDGDKTQLYYVGYWPTANAVVVAHQGTNPFQFLADLTDIEIATESLNSTLFPGVPSGVEVHSGFANEQASTAPMILAEVHNLIATNNASTVISVGHSLGGAIAELDALFFELNLPTNVTVASYTYGTPRVGNAAYAKYFDSVVSNFTRVNNMLDPIPIVPGRSLGFQHPAGEVHILPNNTAVACSLPDDNTDPACTDLSVPTIFQSDLLNHLGPYDGLYIGTLVCF